MGDRPVFHQELGDYFRALRETYRPKMSQRQAARHLQAAGLKTTSNALQQLEAGMVKHPNLDLVRALAVLYRRPYAELRAKVVAVTHDMTDSKGLEGTRTDNYKISGHRTELSHGKTTPPTEGGAVDGDRSNTLPSPGDTSDLLEQHEAVFDQLRATVTDHFTAIYDAIDLAGRVVSGAEPLPADWRQVAEPPPPSPKIGSANRKNAGRVAGGHRRSGHRS